MRAKKTPGSGRTYSTSITSHYLPMFNGPASIEMCSSVLNQDRLLIVVRFWGRYNRLDSRHFGTTMDLSVAKADFFEPIEGESFAVDEQDFSLQLVGVTQLTSSATNPDRHPFSLTFKGRCHDVPTQGLYRLEHPTTGKLEIFLVPVGMDEEDCLFEAVFN